MRKVITSISNSLMAVSISDALQRSGDYAVNSIGACEGAWTEAFDGADIALFEVAYNPGYTIDERLSVISMLRKGIPGCKVLIICDENSSPELARRVVHAKRDRLIDDFVYSSVSESYLTAMLDAL